jgi:hypothetical protein
MILSVGDESVIMDFDMEGFENSYEPTQAYHDVDIEAESESAIWLMLSATAVIVSHDCFGRAKQG